MEIHWKSMQKPNWRCWREAWDKPEQRVLQQYNRIKINAYKPIQIIKGSEVMDFEY